MIFLDALSTKIAAAKGWTPAYLHTYLHPCLPTYTPTYLHNYVHVYASSGSLQVEIAAHVARLGPCVETLPHSRLSCLLFSGAGVSQELGVLFCRCLYEGSCHFGSIMSLWVQNVTLYIYIHMMMIYIYIYLYTQAQIITNIMLMHLRGIFYYSYIRKNMSPSYL